MTNSYAMNLAAAASQAVDEAYSSMLKTITPAAILDTTPTTITYLTIVEQLNKIKEIEARLCQTVVEGSYRDTFYGIIHEEEWRAGVIIRNAALGYHPDWCQGIDWHSRIDRHFADTTAAISGLLLAYNQSDDYKFKDKQKKKSKIVLMGLISDLLLKCANKFAVLVRTEAESAYVQGARDAYLVLGCLYVRVSNHYDPCDICLDELGDHPIVNLRTALMGQDLPPYHPNCRCVIEGIFYLGS